MQHVQPAHTMQQPQAVQTVHHHHHHVQEAPKPTMKMYVAPPDYAPQSIKEAWENYFDAFTRQDLSCLMLDYDETSHVRLYNNTDGAKSEFTGTHRISLMFEQLFEELDDLSGLDAQVTDIDEDAGQVFVCWKCPSSGILAATETLIFSRNYKIWKQNIVHTKVPQCAAALVKQSDPVVTSRMSVAHPPMQVMRSPPRPVHTSMTTIRH